MAWQSQKPKRKTAPADINRISVIFDVKPLLCRIHRVSGGCTAVKRRSDFWFPAQAALTGANKLAVNPYNQGQRKRKIDTQFFFRDEQHHGKKLLKITSEQGI